MYCYSTKLHIIYATVAMYVRSYIPILIPMKNKSTSNLEHLQHFDANGSNAKVLLMAAMQRY